MLWHEFLDNVKVRRVTEALRARYVDVLCVACRFDEDGRLPSIEEMAFWCRLPLTVMEETIAELTKYQLIDKRGKSYHVHDWGQWQHKKSSEAIKQKRYRDKRNALRNALRNGHVTDESHVTLAGARVKSIELEKEEEGNSPLPPSIALGPEYVSVGEFAIQLAGDVSWGSWVDRQGMCGHPAKTIRRCLEECAGAGKISQAYAAAKLRGWAKEGGPPKAKFENNGKTAVQFRPEDTTAPIKRPEMPRTPEYAQAHAMYDRMEADAKRKVATP